HGVACGIVLPLQCHFRSGYACFGARIVGALFLETVVGHDRVLVFALFLQHLTDPVIGDRVGILCLVGLFVPYFSLFGIAEHAIGLGHLEDELGLHAGLLFHGIGLLVKLDRVEIEAFLEGHIGFFGHFVLGQQHR